jgi:hypothetical protein
MSGSVVLDVAIGLGLLYLLLSLVCSAVAELISRVASFRSKTLESGIRSLLDDLQGAGLAGQLYAHPLVASLGRTISSDQGPRIGAAPSYIPGQTFALALLDIVAPAASGARKTLDDLRHSIEKISNESVKRSLLCLLDAGAKDFQDLQARVASWFDDSMDRVSGWYKRKTQTLLLAIALAITVVLNADSVTVTKTLFSTPGVQAAVAEMAAAQTARGLPASGDELATIAGSVSTALGTSLPLGWSKVGYGAGDWGMRLVGWLVTIAAISLGAPFWFDALGKLVNLRSSGARPPRSDAAASGN